MDLYYSLSSPKVVFEVVVEIGSHEDFEPVFTKGQQDQSQKCFIWKVLNVGSLSFENRF